MKRRTESAGGRRKREAFFAYLMIAPLMAGVLLLKLTDALDKNVNGVVSEIHDASGEVSTEDCPTVSSFTSFALKRVVTHAASITSVLEPFNHAVCTIFEFAALEVFHIFVQSDVSLVGEALLLSRKLFSVIRKVACFHYVSSFLFRCFSNNSSDVYIIVYSIDQREEIR